MDTIWVPDLSSHAGPKYQALAAAISEAVRCGALKPGAQLPTVRDLAWRLGITPGTVARAYALSTQKGVTEAVVGRGTFVAQPRGRDDPSAAAALAFMHPPQPLVLRGEERGPVDLRALRLPEVGQTAEVSAAMKRVAASLVPDDLDYPSLEADLELRQALCDWLGEELPGDYRADDMVVTSGGQQALGVVMAATLAGPRPVVLTEDLAYPGIRHAARLARAEILGLEMDREGVVPGVLEQICRRHQPQLCVLTAQGQNPTASRMSLARRQEIVAIARAHDLLLIEDNSYGATDGGIPSFRALAPERSYQIGSLSKSIAPALRLGWVNAPGGQAELVRQVMRHTQFGVSRLLGEIGLDLLRSGAATAIREALRRETAARLESLVNRLGAFDLSWQPGLAFVWLRLPVGWRASAFARAAEIEGVLVRPADEFVLVHGRAPHALRLTLGGTAPRERFEAALGVILRLLCAPPHELSV